MTASRRTERGGSSVVVLGVFVVGMVMVMGAAHVGAALLGRARAQTAADAAALAAADAIALGKSTDQARRDAAATAAENGARLASCRCSGPRVLVAVELAVPVVGRVALVRAAAEVRGRVLPAP